MAIQLQTPNVDLDSKTNLPKQKGFQIRTEDIEGLPSIKRNTNPYDSINFTNIYTDDLSKYKKYNVPTTRHFNWDEQRARNQGTGEKWLNGISKALVTTAGAVVENTLGVVAGVGEFFFGSGYYYDNFIGKSVDKGNEWMREAMPNYKTQAENDMSTGQKLGTANFWADTVANGFGYSLGSLATIYLTGGTGLIARGVNFAGKGAKMSTMYNLSKAITTGTQLADKTFKASKVQKLLTGLNVAEMGLYMSLAESSVEARETQKNSYDSIVARELEERGLQSEHQLGDEILADIRDASYSAGNADFIANLAVLAPTNLLMFGKRVSGYRAALKQNGDVALDAAGKAISQLGARGMFRNGLSRLKPTAQGAATEAFQEGMQFAAKIGATDYNTTKYFDGGSEDMIMSMYQGLSETFGTQEGLESMLVGAIVGGGMGAGGSAIGKPYAQRKKNAKYLSDLLNGGFLENAQRRGGSFNAQVYALERMRLAKEKGDQKAYKDAQNDLIAIGAFDAIENGGYDVYIQKLDDAAQMEDAEFAKQFGYLKLVGIKEQTGSTKQEIVDKHKKKMETFKKTYQDINEAFPPIAAKQGLDKARMSEEEVKAEQETINEQYNLRANLTLGLFGIKDRNRRMKSIEKNMNSLMSEMVDLVNGVPMRDGALNLYNMPDVESDPAKYNSLEEANKVKDKLQGILNILIKRNTDPVKVKEFQKMANDYVKLLGNNNVAVDAYKKLSSDEYFQKQYEERRKEREVAAKQAAKDIKNKKAVDEAKTEEDIKKNVDDAKDEVKVDAEIKRKEFEEKEKEVKNKYLKLNEDLPIEARILKLKSIDHAEFSETELAGLTKAIKELEFEENNKEEVEKEEPVGDLDDIQVEKEEEVTPVKRKIKTKSDPAQLSLEDVLPMEDTDDVPVLSISLKENPTLWVTNKKKVGVDGNGIPNLQEGDTLDGKPIIINQNVLLGDAVGREVTFEIIENDFFTQNHKGKPTEAAQTPIYIRLDGELIGTLPAGLSSERVAILEKLKAGEKVTTKISEIIANNYNNAVLSEATETSYFYNIEEEIGGGSRNNVLLAFTSGVPGETDVVQWQVSEVSPDKNQKDLPKIKASVQTEQTSGRIDQIAVVARPENVPGGKPRIVLTSTANLSEAAKKKVIEAIQNKNYGLAAQIVAASMQIKNADQNPSFLTFDTFKGGEQYLVYYSPRLEKLIRITESEMIKALNNQKATYTIVEAGEDSFISKGKRNTESDKFNLKEDFESFLNNKKYHVDKGFANTTEQYVSPVTGLPYNDYQEYLFSSAETGNRIQGEGHYSILSVDTKTINESLFNNPRVTFERGNLFGKTAEDVISAAELTAMKTVVEQPGKAAVAPQGFKDKFNKKNCK
jgi:hypothetical protein